MKPKKEVILSKNVDSLEAHKRSIEKRIQELALERDAAILTVSRLRNEAKALESQKASHEARVRDAETLEAARVSQHEARLAAFKHDKEEFRKREEAADRSRQQGIEAEKRADSRLRHAENVEIRQQDLLRRIEVERKKLDTVVEAKRQVLANAVIQLEKVEERIVLIYEAEKKNAADEKRNASEKARLSKLERFLEAKNKDAERKIVDGKLLVAQANAALEAAKEVAIQNQLSVDRQWNEIEIQKAGLKAQELRIAKLARDKGIKDELKKLEGK